MTNAEKKLVSLFYILLRDYLPAGTVELIMRDHIEKPPLGADVVFSNKHLAAYAIELKDRIYNMGAKGPWERTHAERGAVVEKGS